MSEKSLWDWLNKKMTEAPCKWQGVRIENCSAKGIPDSFISFEYEGMKYSGHIELKDWSGAKKHPLSREQFNFINSFGGAVLVRVDSGRYVVLCHENLAPLMLGDINYVMRTGERYTKLDFKEKFIRDLSKILPGVKI